MGVTTGHTVVSLPISEAGWTREERGCEEGEGGRGKCDCRLYHLCVDPILTSTELTECLFPLLLFFCLFSLSLSLSPSLALSLIPSRKICNVFVRSIKHAAIVNGTWWLKGSFDDLIKGLIVLCLMNESWHLEVQTQLLKGRIWWGVTTQCRMPTGLFLILIPSVSVAFALSFNLANRCFLSEHTRFFVLVTVQM